MSDLKPCLFCGGPAKIVDQASYNYRVNEGEWFHVGCDDETCFTYWQDSGLYCTDVDAAEAWNMRTDKSAEAIREHERLSRQYYGEHGTVPPQRDLDLWKILEEL